MLHPKLLCVVLYMDSVQQLQMSIGGKETRTRNRPGTKCPLGSVSTDGMLVDNIQWNKYTISISINQIQYYVLSMKYTVLVFAGIKDIVGSDSVAVEIEPNSISNSITIQQLIDTLLQQYNQLDKIIDQCVLSVNLEYVSLDDDTVQLVSTDEIAIIPPISGG